ASLTLERRLGQVKRGVYVSLLILGLLLAALYARENIRVSSSEKALRTAQKAVTSLRPFLETLRQLKEEEARLQPKLEAFKIVLRQGIPWPQLLKELSRVTPKAIALEELISQTGGRLRLKGLSFPDGVGAEGTLARYLSALASSPFFHEVNLVATAEREGYATRALEFEIALTVK
ncbi:MAG: PilN domain-containing protein, partial [Candidatus Methylomirabilales bacterium]